MPTRTSSPDGVRPGPSPINPRADSEAADRSPFTRARATAIRTGRARSVTSMEPARRDAIVVPSSPANPPARASRSVRALAAALRCRQRAPAWLNPSPGGGIRGDQTTAPARSNRRPIPGMNSAVSPASTVIPARIPRARKSAARSATIPFGSPPTASEAIVNSPSGVVMLTAERKQLWTRADAPYSPEASLGRPSLRRVAAWLQVTASDIVGHRRDVVPLLSLSDRDIDMTTDCRVSIAS